MKPGDLIRVREGCGDEGRVGSIIRHVSFIEHGDIDTAIYEILFPEGVEELNSLWLELLSSSAVDQDV